MSNFLRSRAETDGPWYWEAAQTRFCVTAYQICMRSRAADGTTVVLHRGNTNWKILKNDQKHVKTIFNHLFKYNRAFKENFWANRYHYRDCLWESESCISVKGAGWTCPRLCAWCLWCRCVFCSCPPWPACWSPCPPQSRQQLGQPLRSSRPPSAAEHSKYSK